MGRELELERAGDEAVVLREGDSVIAEARAAELCFDLPREVGYEEAEVAAHEYPGYSAHPFPTCFCCGPERKLGDGLRIFPSPLEGSEVVAAPFVPHPGLAGDGGLGVELAWAAVDCPQLWALMLSAPSDSDERVVTGELAASVSGELRAGRRYVVTAWPAGRDEGRLYANAAVIEEGGEPIVLARQSAAVVGPGWGVPLGLDTWRNG